jgi:dihydrofolate reductase
MTTVTSVAASGALALIVAVARNGVIGAANTLPWRLPDDLKHFRALTTGHAVIMGRKTWESLPRPLPGRQNIVVTRQTGYKAVGAETADSLADAMTRVRMPAPAFCIGGGELYAAALGQADVMYATEIARDFVGDTLFPAFDPSQWRETAREVHHTPEGYEYAFVTYVRATATGGVNPTTRPREEH